MRGNHRRPESFRDHILAIVRERYADFGPTLAREKLFERPGLMVAMRDAARLDEGSRHLVARRRGGSNGPAARARRVFR